MAASRGGVMPAVAAVGDVGFALEISGALLSGVLNCWVLETGELVPSGAVPWQYTAYWGGGWRGWVGGGSLMADCRRWYPEALSLAPHASWLAGSRQHWVGQRARTHSPGHAAPALLHLT